MDKFPQSKFMPKPRGHDMPLSLEKNNYSSGKGSVEWLEKNGLKAQKLNLYQVLAPNAYSYIEDYVPILNKTVQSQVHEVGFDTIQYWSADQKTDQELWRNIL